MAGVAAGQVASRVPGQAAGYHGCTAHSKALGAPAVVTGTADWHRCHHWKKRQTKLGI